MKKIIYFLIITIFYISSLQYSFAHPLDISISTASVKSNNLSITTYFHTFEIEYLLKENNINPDWVIDYFENSKIIADYIKDNITISNNQKNCKIEKIELKSDETYKILTDWLWVHYEFKCDEIIENFKISLWYFKEFPLQTNRITFYNLNNWISNIKPFFFKVFTSKIFDKEINLNDKNLSISLDSDNDWISDEEEKIYYTDIYSNDTDWDFYTDKEEIELWLM